MGIRALASAYALDILDTLARHPVGARFSDLQHDLDLAPNTLARRLHELAANGIVDWTDGSYKLTPAGARLWSGAQALASWRS